jgi:multidrug efflux system membrane fusion protein
MTASDGRTLFPPIIDKPDSPTLFERVSRRHRHALGLASAAGILACAGCWKRPSQPMLPPPAVTVARPVQREVIEWDEYTGHLDAVESVEVRARVSGLIISAPFHEGTVVNANDLLLEIDVRPFQAELDSRLADVARAQAQLDLSQIEFKRIEGMPQDARTETEYDTAAASVRQAQAVVASAKAAVDAARLNVEWCHVVAPITGRISRKDITPGNLITGGGGQATLLTTITSIDPIYCYVDADERSVLKYQRLAQEGKRISARDARIPCFLALSDESGFPHEGEVDFVDNRVDPTTGTIRARAVFANTDTRLIPGYFARVRVPGSGRYQTLLVPDAAVTTDLGQKQLLVVKADDTVEARSVELGALFGELRAIQSGISLDDRIVINGLLQARPGIKVAPRESAISMDTFRLTSPGSPATQALPPASRPAVGNASTSSPAASQSAPPPAERSVP